jgi:nucleoid-associated protein YgaU
MFVRKSQTVLIVLIALVALALFAARPTQGAGQEERYVVQPGDTLWALAVERSGGDPRETIWRIKERNGLERSTVQPGQVLYIPR